MTLMTNADLEPFGPEGGLLRIHTQHPVPCHCTGPQNGDPACPCAMRNVRRASIAAPQHPAPTRVNRNLLALDLGTKTGWAVGTRDGRKFCGTEDFSPRSSWHPGQRFTRFRAWLNSTITRHQISHIVFEKVVQGPHSSGAAGDVYGAFWGMLLVVAESHNILPDSVHTMTVKKHITGSGRAEKADVIKAIRALGYLVDSDNAADAAGILELAIWAEVNGVDVAPAKATSKATKAKAVAAKKGRKVAAVQEQLEMVR